MSSSSSTSSSTATSSTSLRQFEAVTHSALYARVRPEPPPAVMEAIAAFHQGALATAADLGCGSGQLTSLLAGRCGAVVASDVSQAMLDKGRERGLGAHVRWVQGRAEEVLGGEEGQVDLVTICQALHWTSPSLLFERVGSVLRPGGTLAVLGYDFSRPCPTHPKAAGLSSAMSEVYLATGPHWSPRRLLVDERYSNIPPPAWARGEAASEHPATTPSSLGAWADYVRSWSGFQRLEEEEGEEAASALLATFLHTCREQLGEGEVDPYTLPLDIRTDYWMTLYRK